MKIININSTQDISQAVKLALNYLIREIPFVIPTDTVYGLAARADSTIARERLLKLKGYTENRSLACLVPNLSCLNKVIVMNKNIMNLITNSPPGKITVIAKLQSMVDAFWYEIAHQQNIGFRIPSNKFLQKLFQLYNKPILASSANIKNQPPVHTLPDLIKTFPQVPIFYLPPSNNENVINRASAVVDTTTNPIKIIRTGAMSRQQIHAILNH